MVYLLVLLHTILTLTLGLLFGFTTKIRKAQRAWDILRVAIVLIFGYMSMELLSANPGPEHTTLLQGTFWCGVLMFVAGSYIGSWIKRE